MQCWKCGTEVPTSARFCLECGVALGVGATDNPRGVDNRGGVMKARGDIVGGPKIVDQSVHYHGAASGSRVVECPLCHVRSELKDTFRCPECGKDNLCKRHFDEAERVCEECASARASRRREATDQIRREALQRSAERERAESLRRAEAVMRVEERRKQHAHRRPVLIGLWVLLVLGSAVAAPFTRWSRSFAYFAVSGLVAGILLTAGIARGLERDEEVADSATHTFACAVLAIAVSAFLAWLLSLGAAYVHARLFGFGLPR